MGFDPDTDITLTDLGAGSYVWPQHAPFATEKVGVLLLNLGGPDKLEDVQPFLYNLFVDPEIIRLPPQIRFLQPVIALLISTLRAPKSQEGYKAIGGGECSGHASGHQGWEQLSGCQVIKPCWPCLHGPMSP